MVVTHPVAVGAGGRGGRADVLGHVEAAGPALAVDVEVDPQGGRGGGGEGLEAPAFDPGPGPAGGQRGVDPEVVADGGRLLDLQAAEDVDVGHPPGERHRGPGVARAQAGGQAQRIVVGGRRRRLPGGGAGARSRTGRRRPGPRSGPRPR